MRHLTIRRQRSSDLAHGAYSGSRTIVFPERLYAFDLPR
jgi:hypothetical protein